MRLDFEMWMVFISNPGIFARPFLDLTENITANVMDMYSDASRNPELGMGATFKDQWTFTAWDADFISTVQPSIEYLELYALLVGVVTFGNHLKNKRIILFCDNQSVVDMVNATSSSCKNCMVLIRLLVLQGLILNIRIYARHVKGSLNFLSDSLSRLQFNRFKCLQDEHNKYFKLDPEPFPSDLWPMQKLWLK